jgi:hypothetical protein
MNMSIFYIEMLEEYSRELGVDTTLAELIESHRELRNKNIASIKRSREEESKYVAQAMKRAEEMVLKGDYIRIADLKKMTLSELANLIAE